MVMVYFSVPAVNFTPSRVYDTIFSQLPVTLSGLRTGFFSSLSSVRIPFRPMVHVQMSRCLVQIQHPEPHPHGPYMGQTLKLPRSRFFHSLLHSQQPNTLMRTPHPFRQCHCDPTRAPLISNLSRSHTRRRLSTELVEEDTGVEDESSFINSP